MAIPLNLTQLFSNNAVSLLVAPISEQSTSLEVMAGMGESFPSPGSGEYFLITLEDQAATRREIIKVTGRAGDILTFDLADRGLEDTEIAAWSSGLGNDTLVDHRITAGTLRRAAQLPLAQFTPGQQSFNQNYTLIPGAQTVLELEINIAPGSSCLYVGGLRQKLNVDYAESAPNKLTLAYSLSAEDIALGQHITIDFVPMAS